MDEYRILSYKPIVTESLMRELCFSIDNNFFENSGVLSGSYNHEMYGFEDGDDDNAIAHAAGIINQIQKVGLKEDLKYKLMEDVSNYFECIECGLGFEEPARKMIEAALWSGCFWEVYKMIIDFIGNNEDDLELNEIIFSLADLFIRAGDHLLFIEENPLYAMLYYSLLYELSKRKDYEVFSIDSKWNDRYIAHRQIFFGYTGVDFGSINDGFLTKCKKHYDLAIIGLKSYKYDSLQYANCLLDMMPENIDEISDDFRLAYSMILSIKRNCIMNILYLMSEYDIRIAEEYENEIKDALLNINGNAYILLKKWVEKLPENQGLGEILRFVRVIYTVNKIWSILAVNKFPLKAAYYTSLDTFKYLLPEACAGEKEDECGKLSVMHLAYMNDPNEGMVLRKSIFGENGLIQAETERKELKSPYVFVKCFTSMIDYLPMWHMYGDSAAGVCLVIEWNSENNDSLYNVCYLEKTSEGYKCLKKWNERLGNRCTEINNALKELKDVADMLRDRKEKLILDSLIDPILYLFKDNSYSYEQELRIMYQFQQSNKQIKHTNQTPPKLFVTHDKILQIKEVILGPKFENAVTLLPYLNEQLELMAEKIDVDKPIVTLSNIEFR